MFGEFLPHYRYGQSISIGSRSGHRVDRVANHDDASTQWYFLPCQSNWVTIAVPPFVMMSDAPKHFWMNAPDRLDDIHTSIRVGTYQLTLLRCQRTLLTENLP